MQAPIAMAVVILLVSSLEGGWVRANNSQSFVLVAKAVAYDRTKCLFIHWISHPSPLLALLVLHGIRLEDNAILRLALPPLLHLRGLYSFLSLE